MKKIVLILVLVLLIAGCGGGSEDTEGVSEVWQTTFESVERIVDYEAQVVCYIYLPSTGGSIDCLPISDTALPRE